MKPAFSCTCRMRPRISSGRSLSAGTGKRLMANSLTTSHRAVSTVDGNHHAADEGGRGRSQEHHGRGDLLGRAAPAHRREAPHLVLDLGLGMAALGAAHVVRGVAGIDAIDADVVRTPFDRELAAELVDAALRGAVGGK